MTIPTKEEIDAAIELDALTMATDFTHMLQLASLVRSHPLLSELDGVSVVAGMKLGLRIGEARGKKEAELAKSTEAT